MSKLISGKEAWIALYDGFDIQIRLKDVKRGWLTIKHDSLTLSDIKSEHYEFRLKPRTITINGIEVPAPFEPKDGEDCRAYVIDTRNVNGYDWQHSSHYKSGYIVWRTESEIKQVVSALRSVFKPQ